MGYSRFVKSSTGLFWVFLMDILNIVKITNKCGSYKINYSLNILFKGGYKDKWSAKCLSKLIEICIK